MTRTRHRLRRSRRHPNADRRLHLRPRDHRRADGARLARRTCTRSTRASRRRRRRRCARRAPTFAGLRGRPRRRHRRPRAAGARSAARRRSAAARARRARASSPRARDGARPVEAERFGALERRALDATRSASSRRANGRRARWRPTACRSRKLRVVEPGVDRRKSRGSSDPKGAAPPTAARLVEPALRRHADAAQRARRAARSAERASAIGIGT